ncbi:hypothetical protein NGM10_00680 [Halorussus salilacus]|uniref:hypothetical protein n=1 Tax=Halorussus salilacus TaxID=2953750 RepID=UPI00209FF66C|nr:hypothetical protein [Halorussus salilacus]USZ68272.1 hypothetical protein NGM10_00680 [Halorussus salilacus]
MPMKRTRPATDYDVIDRWEGGVGWIAHPDEAMLRASHALAVDDEVWVVDPVDAPGVDDLFAEFGEVAGVVVLLNRHYRDADELAQRHDVPVYVPAWFDRAPDLSAEVRRFDETLPGTDYRLLRVFDRFGWEEGALYDEDEGTLLVPESVGNAPYFTTDDERLGVHPMMRLFPPSVLRGLRPDRVLVGHGPGALDDAARALDDALGGARRRAPTLFARNFRMLLPV